MDYADHPSSWYLPYLNYTIKIQSSQEIIMLEPIFKLIPVKNYRHPYEVKKVSYMETGDPRLS